MSRCLKSTLISASIWLVLCKCKPLVFLLLLLTMLLNFFFKEMAEQAKPKHSLYKICQVLWNLRSDSYIEKREL